jgi:hypothetical protein
MVYIKEDVNMEEKKDGESCCATKKCCGKAAAAVALLLVGGVGGFFAGRCEKLCPTKAAPAAVEAPATK